MAGLSRFIAQLGRMAEFRGRHISAQALFRAALLADTDAAYPRRMIEKRAGPRPGSRNLRLVALGTTGTCNASCVHCPTGKASTAHVPRGTMPMEIFGKIIDGIRDNRVEVTSQISFGLFGDGLVDPLVIERARYVHETLPDVRLSINTNGAAFNAKKHAGLLPYVSDVALHCESLDEDTFNYLMTPLRLKNVLPKYSQILETFLGKVKVSVPVSKANFDEIRSMENWFKDRGATAVVFDPISNRCAEDDSIFESLAIFPVSNMCDASIMADLIVDCDGLVLSCCQDFQRIVPIGDFSRQTFLEVFSTVERKLFESQLAHAQHRDIATCSRCRSDQRTPDFPHDWAQRAGASTGAVD